jgi:retron-type reverse transcriptase
MGDRRIIRLIQKWLNAGVLEEGQLIETTVGTPQASVASPLLANVYLHYVYDLWPERWRLRHAYGIGILPGANRPACRSRPAGCCPSTSQVGLAVADRGSSHVRQPVEKLI